MKQRPTLDQYYISIARVVSKRSTCLRREVGAVLVIDKQILATGYNGAPTGLANCIDIGCMRLIQGIPSGTQHEKCRAVHAEQNAIIQAARHGVCTLGAIIYCTHQPCIICVKMLINAGIKRVVYEQSYPDEDSLKMLYDAGIIVEQISGISL